MKIKREAAIQILNDLQAEGLDYIDTIVDYERMSNAELRTQLCVEGVFRDSVLDEVA
jgi:hypothetical protein